MSLFYMGYQPSTTSVNHKRKSMLINNNASSITQQTLAATPPEVDESKFIVRGDLSSEALNYEDGATISYKVQTPSEAWDNYINSSTGSMIEVSSTIPAGFKDVVEKLTSILAENGIVAPQGMSFKHSFAEDENGEELKVPVLIVEGVAEQAVKEQIEEILNSGKYSSSINNFIALDNLSASENTSIAYKRDAVFGINERDKNNDSGVSYRYQQDFALTYTAGNWQMDTSLEKVELRFVKIAS